MRRPPAMLALVLLSACKPALDDYEPPYLPKGDDTAAPGDDTGRANGPQVEEVTPLLGTNAGGDRLSLSGSYLNRVTRITFDGEEAEILEQYGGALVVTSPAVDAEGWVDAVLEHDGGASTVPDAFFFLQDREKLAGALGVLFYNLDAELLGVAAGSAYVALPYSVAEVDLYGLVGEESTCTDGSTAATWPELQTLGLDEVSLSQGSTTEALALDASSEIFVDEDFDATALDWDGSTGDLVLPEGDWPALTVEDAFALAELPELLTPGADTKATGEQVAVTWTPTSADKVYLQLFTCTLKGETCYVQEERVCITNNDGSYTLPSGQWDDFYGANYVYVRLGELATRRVGTLPDRSTAAFLTTALTGQLVAIDDSASPDDAKGF